MNIFQKISYIAEVEFSDIVEIVDHRNVCISLGAKSY